MKLAVVLVQLFLLDLALAQEENEVTCSPTSSSGGGLLGFTALSPDQLRVEIRQGMKETLSEVFPEEESEDQVALLATVSMLQETVEELNHSLPQLQERLIRTMQDSLEGYIRNVVAEAVRNLTVALQETLSTLDTRPRSTTPGPPSTSSPSSSLPPPPPLPPGISPSDPADSCLDVLHHLPSAPSGNYWLNSPNGAVGVYCHMSTTCGNLTGGWVRVANVNMSDPTHECPGAFVEMGVAEPTQNGPERLCVPDSTGSGCFAHTFPVLGPKYSQVCGRVLAYQDSTPNGFFAFHVNPSRTLDDVYMDGISLTHGSPRRHVWTFVAALDETGDHLSACRCSNIHSDKVATVPPFIGENYFCDTASRGDVSFRFYPDDPLWDGRGCGQNSTCCSYNDPPWFFRELTSLTSDGLEMRVCRDAGVNNENMPFEVVELYVR